MCIPLLVLGAALLICECITGGMTGSLSSARTPSQKSEGKDSNRATTYFKSENILLVFSK